MSEELDTNVGFLWTTKICRSCGKEKCLEEYAKHRNICKQCRADYVKQWQSDNADIQKIKKKQWRDSNAEILKQKRKQKVLTDVQRQKQREHHRIYKAKHRIQYNIYDYKRRSILKDAGTFTEAEWTTLKEKYNNMCLACKCKSCKLTIDHVLPLSLGGSNTIDNIQPLCGECNTRKNNKYIDYRG